MTAAALLETWETMYPESSASPGTTDFIRFVLEHAPGPWPSDSVRSAETAVLDWLSGQGLPPVDPSDVDGPGFTARLAAIFTDAGAIRIAKVLDVDDQGLAAARDLIDETTGDLGRFLLSQVDKVLVVDTERPMLAGTSTGIPRCLLLNSSLLADEVRLAEHLLHEAVHIAFYKTYLERTPMRRSYFLGDREIRICAMWHNTTFSPDAESAWWGPERCLHAFLVYTHLFVFWARLRARPGGGPEPARAGLRTALFAARYLGERLREVAPEVFTASATELIDRALATLPEPASVAAALDRFRGLGLVRAVSPPSSGGAGSDRVMKRLIDRRTGRAYLLTESSAFTVDGPKPDTDSPGTGQAWDAGAIDDRLAVDGLALRMMLRA